MTADMVSQKQKNRIEHSNFMNYLLDDEQIYKVIQIGLRGLRSIGTTYNHHKLLQITHHELFANNIWLHNINRIIENITAPVIGYITFDIDILDPTAFPYVDFPIANGLSLIQILTLLNDIFVPLNIPIIGCDLVEGTGGGNIHEYEPALQVLIKILDIMIT